MNVIELKPRANCSSGGFVYVLMMVPPEGSPVFKIGKANNIALRLDQIQPLLPFDSVLAFAIWSKDALAQEAYIHRYYAKYRLLGEWFRLPRWAMPQFAELQRITSQEAPEAARKQFPDPQRLATWFSPALARLEDDDYDPAAEQPA